MHAAMYDDHRDYIKNNSAKLGSHEAEKQRQSTGVAEQNDTQGDYDANPEELEQLGCIYFVQAEDGIRDGTVTGVQTCALPISVRSPMVTAFSSAPATQRCSPAHGENTSMNCKVRAKSNVGAAGRNPDFSMGGSSWVRSQERRVGDECRSRSSTERYLQWTFGDL